MPTRSGAGVVAVAVALVVAAGGCAAPRAGTHPEPAPRPDRTPVIVDADRYGAVLLDPIEREYVGVRRDGTVAWHSPAGIRDLAAVMCLARCPDAVLSGSAASRNAADVPDPEPLLIVGGERHPLSGLVGPKRWVLTAVTANDLVVHRGDGAGRWWLETRYGGDTDRVPVGGPRTSWRQSADDRHAIALSAAGTAAPGVAGTYEVRWFDRDGVGWRPAGSAPVTVAGVAACIRPDGASAILIGQRPAVLDRTGAQRPITDLERAGTCALTRTGGIVADLGSGTNGARSLLRAFDATGATTWGTEVRAAAMVTADPTASRVAYVTGEDLVEVDPSTGAVLRTLPGIRAAVYDGTGGLVVVHADSRVAWLDAGAAPP